MLYWHLYKLHIRNKCSSKYRNLDIVETMSSFISKEKDNWSSVLWDILPCSQIDVDIDLTTQQYIPEDCELHTHHYENLKSQNENCFKTVDNRTNYFMLI
jgi:hypothetical protein